MKLLGKALVLLAVFVPLTAKSQAAEPTRKSTIAEIFLARANADGKAGDAAENFVITDIPIFCVVRFTSPGVAAVKMDLIALNVPGVKGESRVVSTTYTTKETEDRVNFSGRPKGNWVPGRYRADVFVGEKKVRTIEFEIKNSPTESANPTAPQPKTPVRKIVKRATIAERYAI